MEELKQIVCQTIDSRSDDLNAINRFLWENPELSWEEHLAHDHLTDLLEREGFTVQQKTPLETAFVAKYGNSGGLKVGICCEYDALPGVGHACGHNLIAEVGIAASLALKAVIEKHPDTKLQVICYGTPAEEMGSGKPAMIDKGVFEEVDICLMSHPAPFEIPTPTWYALQASRVVFHGKPSHAAAAPWEGVNALDAAVMFYTSVSCLRQQIKPTQRIHQVITDGGKKPNIIPERSELEFYVRALDFKEMLDLHKRVMACAEAAAMATGCTFESHNHEPAIKDVITNPTLIHLYVSNAKRIDPLFTTDDASKMFASTDMGNLSHYRPSIHPLFKIATQGANHTHKFTEGTGAAENQIPTLNSAKSMAMTVVDVVCDPTLLKKIKQEFKAE